jgi:hypothetical protein
MPDKRGSAYDALPDVTKPEPPREPGSAESDRALVERKAADGLPADQARRTSGAEADRWRIALGPLSLERHSLRPLGFLRRGSRQGRSLRARLIKYGLIVVAVLLAMQFVGSAFKWLRLPHISISSPVGPPKTSVTNIGPVIRNRLEGINNPAPAVANYLFDFQIKRTRTILWFWTVGFSDTYHVSGEGYSRVLLNPGGSYWKQHPDAFALTVNKQPVTAANGSVRPGDITLVVTLPQPNLPRSTADVRLDPTSGPISGAAHWIGCVAHQSCGAADLAKVYFTPQVEQMVAYQKLTCVAGHDQALAAKARQEAYSTIYGWLSKFSQALHYNLKLSINWVTSGSDQAQPPPSYCSAVNGSTVNLP